MSHVKTSIPKLHHIKWKDSGFRAANIKNHPDKNNHLADLKRDLDAVLDVRGKNMSLCEIVGVLEFIKMEHILPD